MYCWQVVNWLNFRLHSEFQLARHAKRVSGSMACQACYNNCQPELTSYLNDAYDILGLTHKFLIAM